MKDYRVSTTKETEIKISEIKTARLKTGKDAKIGTLTKEALDEGINIIHENEC